MESSKERLGPPTAYAKTDADKSFSHMNAQELLEAHSKAQHAEIERLQREAAHHLEARLNAGKAMQEANDAAAVAEEELDRLRAALEQHRQLLLEARDTVATYCQNEYGCEQVALIDAMLGPAQEVKL